MPRLSSLASNLTAETAFTVLAMARALKAKGKDVVELEIGDSPFPARRNAKGAGIQAIEENQTGYCPSLGLPDFRAAAAASSSRPSSATRRRPRTSWSPRVPSRSSSTSPRRCSTRATACLIFSPHFPTYIPNLERRGARAGPGTAHGRARVPSAVPSDVAHFLETDPKPRAIFLNSPHNPTGGVATREDLAAIADVVRGTDLMVFSDEPYCHMVWRGRHESILAEPGMLEHTVAAYTFSKSYSMSGWRIGFAVAHPDGGRGDRQADQHDGLVQPAAWPSVPPRRPWSSDARPATTTWNGSAARSSGSARACERIDGFRVVRPAGTFYVFPDVRSDLQPTGDHLARPGALPARRRRRQIRRGLPGRRMLRRGRRAASSASVAPSPTSGSTRPSNSYPSPCSASIASALYLDANPQYLLQRPYALP